MQFLSMGDEHSLIGKIAYLLWQLLYILPFT